MATFRLYQTAQTELEDIWYYSFQTWGEEQANRYLQSLYDCLQKLADKQLPWRSLSRMLNMPGDNLFEIYCYHHDRHYLFFKPLDNGDIGITCVLHDVMDIPVRLAEDLKKIS